MVFKIKTAKPSASHLNMVVAMVGDSSDFHSKRHDESLEGATARVNGAKCLHCFAVMWLRHQLSFRRSWRVAALRDNL